MFYLGIKIAVLTNFIKIQKGRQYIVITVHFTYCIGNLFIINPIFSPKVKDTGK